MRFHTTSAMLLLASLASAAQAQDAPATPDKPAHEPVKTLLKDPHDGDFDMSRWLLEHKGFLPVPIIITDPALGTGGGVALTFFHRPEGAATTRTSADGRKTMVPPNIYGFGGVRTSNGSKAYGGGAILHFKDDQWRYRGGVAKTDINLDFYTPGRFLAPQKIGYNMDGVMSLQQVFRRVGEQDLFVGLAWIYMDLDIGFDIDTDRNQFTPKELSERSSGLGLSLEFDDRDNSFTPNSGWLGMIEGNFYDDLIGSDNDFQSYRGHAFGYLPFGKLSSADERFVLGGRIDARWANGDVPFYRLPYIDLRGIGSARYQDTRAATLETELRWNVTPRWALIGFVGGGRTWGRHNSFGDGQTQVAKGTGVRYLLARQLGLYTGIDYAWGPEDETFYVQVGSAWR
ncbi:outer membrane protein assembly factor [Lysobacter sp. S4-A87]|uniref:BamA/TamA family outer membrane protein n=1 Tax=Lysobacter sp. S4-A87 TaxID=2925843 RepID=UPI001F53375A|nr:BamA/TamA family outer membrane protein [Lysobacter sp. S4-A87]UNK51036.1 outer membrane protein assembly factor [Lysobacter sp. S4-A87]